jgi:uncharacterized delta-60 repeat protein
MGSSKGWTRAAAALTAMVLFAVAAMAQASGATTSATSRPLDPTFGSGGRVIAAAPAEPGKSQFEDMAREPDGRFVLRLRREPVVGVPTQEIEMRTAGGALDESFGSGGKLVVESEFRGVVATLSDGDILVGVTSCGGRPSSIEMLDPTGAPVAGFGRDGCGPHLDAEPEFAATDSQGRILLAGTGESCAPRCYHDVEPVAEVLVARLSADGRLDDSFGKGGVVEVWKDDGIQPEPYSGTRPLGLTSMPDGAVQIAANRGLIRLDEAGGAVAGFGEGGIVASDSSERGGASLRPDGGLLVAEREEGKESVVVRKTGPDGEPDVAFGTEGTARIQVPEKGEVSQVAESPAGSVTIAIEPPRFAPCGACGQGLTLVRLAASGEPEPSFGRAGVVEIPPTSPRIVHPEAARAAALLVDVDGSAFVAGADSNEQGSISAVTPGGTPDPGFGVGGVATEELDEPVQLEPTGLALGSDERLIVMNRRANLTGIPAGFVLAFDPRGRRQPLGQGAESVETLFHGDLEADGGGRFVLWDKEDKRRTLHAVDGEGGALPSYGQAGVATMPKVFHPEAVVPAHGGGVAVVGHVKGDMAVLRFDGMGHAVTSFGHAGLDVIRFPGAHSAGYAGLDEADGDLVVTGWVGDHVGAVRLRPDGHLDRSFGRHGVVRGLLTPRRFGPVGVQIAPFDGGYVIGTGEERHEQFSSAGLIRLDRRGHLVRSFGRDGVVYKGATNAPMALFTAGGRIVVVTDSHDERDRPYSAHGGITLWAYRSNGAVDRGFGRRGRDLFGTSASRGPGFSPDAAIQRPDGKVVVAGTRRVGLETKLELVQFP